MYLVLQERVFSLEAKVKDHEDYNTELQEVEKWLLQMSGRLVAPDLLEMSSLETITQQLAHHKVQLISPQGGYDCPTSVCVCVHTCMYMHMYACMYICMCVHTRVHVYVHMSVFK